MSDVYTIKIWTQGRLKKPEATVRKKTFLIVFRSCSYVDASFFSAALSFLLPSPLTQYGCTSPSSIESFLWVKIPMILLSCQTKVLRTRRSQSANRLGGQEKVRSFGRWFYFVRVKWCCYLVEVSGWKVLQQADQGERSGGGEKGVTGAIELDGQVTRSEERRVGKECRSRWTPDH